jgi:hypothetical protein
VGGDALVKLQDVVADGYYTYIIHFAVCLNFSAINCYNSSSSSAFLVCELELWIHHRTSM